MSTDTSTDGRANHSKGGRRQGAAIQPWPGRQLCAPTRVAAVADPGALHQWTATRHPSPERRLRAATRVARWVAGAVLSVLQLAAAAGEEQPGAAEREPWLVSLGSETLVPDPGGLAAITGSDRPFLLQLSEPPDLATVGLLETRGITIERYAGGRAYVARCRHRCLAGGLDGLAVRAVTPLTPAMKVASVFRSDPSLMLEAEEPVLADVVFAAGTTWEEALGALGRAGIEVRSPGFIHRRSATVLAPWSQLEDLLTLPEVVLLEPTMPEPAPLNTATAERLLADRVVARPEFLGADGSGVGVAVMDWFPSESHADLEDRVTWLAVRPGESLHGLWVSGTIAGAGLGDAKARGIAPGAQLFWFSMNDFRRTFSDILGLHQRHGIAIANNSWGIRVGWWQQDGQMFWSSDTWAWSYYHELAAAADDLARSANVLVVVGAGNDRELSHLGPHKHTNQFGEASKQLHEDLHPPNPSWGSLAGPANAKNALILGGATKDDGMSTFAVWGPSAGGRVKPDLVTPGVDIFTTSAGNGYFTGSGTSLSCAAASGSAALLADYYRRRHSTFPDALTLKALLIHSTRDLGQPGPDYQFGHGQIDMELAARIVNGARLLSHGRMRRRLGRGDGAGEDVQALPTEPQDVATSGKTTGWVVWGSQDGPGLRRMRFVLPEEAGELRATLVWHDPAGSGLVNDLDLWLLAPDGSRVDPFVLDPAHPEAPATRAANHADNVEHVRLTSPAGGVWEVVVQASWLALPPQRYVLLLSSGQGNLQLPRPDRGRGEILGLFATSDAEGAAQIRPKSAFARGEPLGFCIDLAVTESTNMGLFWSSVALYGELTDASGTAIFKQGLQTHTLPETGRLRVVRSGLTIPQGMAAGIYTMRVTLRLGNGFETTRSCEFRVTH